MANQRFIYGFLVFLPWRRQWHPTPVLFLGKSHGRRSLVGCSPWGREESDMTEWLHFSFFGSFFITNSVSVLVINLFMFSISSWFSLSRFLRIYPCLVGCPVSVQSLSRVRLFTTPWTAAHQAPPSMGFSKKEYWSGVPLPSQESSKLLCVEKISIWIRNLNSIEW